ncbi:MAG: Rieske (2Fe-2S) protein [Janthinobacterium lividum]
MPDVVWICPSSALHDGKMGVLRDAVDAGGHASVFFVRYGGTVYGYLNRCAHMPMELDWNPGQFFDSSGLYLICATHGALYAPHTGRCEGGPCVGARLRALHVEERDTPAGRAVFWLPDAQLRPA